MGSGKLSANRTYEQMLGCTAEEMQSVGILDQLTHPDDRKAGETWFQPILDGKCNHLKAEKRYLLRDGRVVWANIELTALEGSTGKPDFVLGTAVDVTERKWAELEMEREGSRGSSQRGEKHFPRYDEPRNRTPLNGVLGMTELVLDTDLNAEQREYLELEDSADYLLAVINDMLDFSKIEAGKFDLETITSTCAN